MSLGFNKGYFFNKEIKRINIWEQINYDNRRNEEKWNYR